MKVWSEKLTHRFHVQTDNSNDLEKAFALWIEIQEDKLQPPNEFLITLANILKRNDRPVPFPVPQADETTFTSKEKINSLIGALNS